MNKKQNWILKSAYHSELCVQQVMDKFNLDYDNFYILISEMEQYTTFHQEDIYEESVITLTPKGESYVEALNRERAKVVSEWVRYGITIAIALVALVFSIIAITSELGWINIPPT